MYTFDVEGFDPAHAAIQLFLDKRDTVATGKASRDVSRAHGEDMGWGKAFGEMLMLMATEQRIRKIQLLLGTHEEIERVPAPSPWEITSWLEKHRHEYRKIFNEVAGRGRTTKEREETTEHGRERQAAYFQNVLGEWITHIIWPRDLADQYENRRRALIRTGKMHPTQADAEWLADELQEMEAVADPLKKLVAKAKNAGA